MSPVNYIEFLIISLSFHVFTLLTYVIYYGGVINNNYKDLKQEYDYIIVGSGTAGSAIGHQLATETNYSFIVLEAGGRGHNLYRIPVLGPLLHGSMYDWHFETVPQNDACLAMKDKICKSPQGKIIGGSSAINNMVYVRGNTSHYVDWFHGKHSKEYIHQQFEYIEREILHLDNIKYNSELSDAILDAAKELGYNHIGIDFDLGFSKSTVNQKNGKRSTSSDKLDISKHILTNALVEKILFGNGKTAIGVKLMLSGVSYELFARNAVILSAGAYNTPKILQLSGIGPKDILRKFNIRTTKYLPVGKNLQDHVTTGLDLVHYNKPVSVNAMDMINPFNVFDYFYNGRGPLTSPGCEAIGFMSTKNDSTPDLQFMVLSAGLASDRGTHLKKIVNINDVSWNNYFTKFDQYVGTILPIVLHPKTKGEVYINSIDPEVPPIINPKYLSNKDDLKVLINGLRLVKKFVETNAMRDISANINQNIFPGCEMYDFFTDSYLECYVKHLTLSSFHPIGTCSMGLSTSKEAVVDTSFQVIGVNKLYVVDASVLPTMPSGNINAAVAMMARVFFDTVIRSSSQMHKNISYCNKTNSFYDDEFVCTI